MKKLKTKWWLPVAALLGVILVAYGRTLGYSFVDFDDDFNITQNIWLRSLSWSGIAYFWREAYMHMYAPLTYTFWGAVMPFAVDQGGNVVTAFPFHFLNVVFFFTTVALIYRVIHRLFKNQWAAFAGACLFAVHPTQVETVAWASSFRGILSGFFCMLSLEFYLRDIERRKQKTNFLESREYWIAVACFVGALLSKPAAVILPIWLAVLGYFVLKQKPGRLVKELGLFGALGFLNALFCAWVQPTPTFVQNGEISTRVLVMFDSLCRYVKLFFWPQRLTIDYGIQVSSAVQTPWIFFSILTIMCALGLCSFLYIRHKKVWPLVGLLLFLSYLVPVSGLRPFDMERYSTIADRYLFLSLFGPALCLAWLITDKKLKRSWSPYAAGLYLLILLSLTVRQVGIWRDNYTLFLHAFLTNPNSWLSCNKLASVFEKRNENSLAESLYRRSVEIRPNPIGYSGLAVQHSKAGREAMAYENFAKAVALEPESPVGNYNLGLSLVRLGRKTEAVTVLRKSAALAAGWQNPLRALAELEAKPEKKRGKSRQ